MSDRRRTVRLVAALASASLLYSGLQAMSLAPVAQAVPSTGPVSAAELPLLDSAKPRKQDTAGAWGPAGVESNSVTGVEPAAASEPVSGQELMADFDPEAIRVVERSEFGEILEGPGGVQVGRATPEPMAVAVAAARDPKRAAAAVDAELRKLARDAGRSAATAEEGPVRSGTVDGFVRASTEVVDLDELADSAASGLGDGAAAGGFGVAAHPLDPVFASGTGGAGNVVLSVAAAGDDASSRRAERVRFGLAGAGESRAEVAGSKVTYPGIEPGVDAVYEVTTGSVKETLVVEDRGAAADGVWEFGLSLPQGLSPKLVDGDVLLRDGDGTTAITIPIPYVWDSSATEARAAADVNGRWEVEHVSGAREARENQPSRWTLRLVVDGAWLEDPARVYPVMVDPTVAYGPSGYRSLSTQGVVAVDPNIRIGNTRTTTGIWRTRIAYPYEQLFGRQITNAWVHTVFLDGAVALQPVRIRQSTGVAYDAVGSELWAEAQLAGGDTHLLGQLYSRFRAHIDTRVGGLVLAYIGSAQPEYTYKYMRHAMYFDVNTPPTISSASIVVTDSGNSARSVTPTINATASDAEGDEILYQYTVGSVANPDQDVAWISGWIPSSTATVPAGMLEPGKQYGLRVHVTDYCLWYVAQCGYPADTKAVTWVTPPAFTTNRPPSTPTNLEPSGKVATLTPTLSVAAATDPEARPIRYRFTVATGTDGLSGVVVDSGLQSVPSWSVPTGVLSDGMRYTWTVRSYDGTDYGPAAAAESLDIDLRTGDPGASPAETVGPVTVNLTSGNAIVGTGSPAFSTAGGDVGLSFVYNSQRSQVTYGLRATYRPKPAGGVAGAAVLSRIEP